MSLLMKMITGFLGRTLESDNELLFSECASVGVSNGCATMRGFVMCHTHNFKWGGMQVIYTSSAIWSICKSFRISSTATASHRGRVATY